MYVWMGGGGLASDERALLLHYDGHELRDESANMRGTIWWIHGTSSRDVWAVGESGLVLHWDGSVWSPGASGTTANLYGVWAAEANDVWAVGGSPVHAGQNDVLLHYDGVSWGVVPPPRSLGATYFKIWGLSASDVDVVASAGLALHYDGTSWTEITTGESAPLVTVHGDSARVLAIGGPPATLVAWTGTAWKRQPVPAQMSGAMTGIFVDESGTTFMVGERYQRYRQGRSGDFVDDTEKPPLFGDLHAVWGDGAGNAFAVGGNYVALTSAQVKPRGVVARYAE